MRLVKVGDTVNWSGGWGARPPEPTVVTGIEALPFGEKEGGIPVESADLDSSQWYVFDLANGHWAYKYQINLAGLPVGGYGMGILPDGQQVI